MPKKLEKELQTCLGRDENLVTDGLVLLPCQTKSKRRRVRKKNKVAVTISISEQEQQDLRETREICQLEKQAVDSVIDERLEAPAKKNTGVGIDCDCIPIINCDEALLEMDNNKDSLESKNRIEIKAKRKEKKQAKLAARVKNKNQKDDNPTPTEQSQQLSIQKEEESSEKKSEFIQSATNSVTNILNSIPTVSNDSIGKEEFVKESTPNKSIETVELKKEEQSKPETVKKTEKRREEIMAEREARKQAKLNAKLKTKSNQIEKSETSTNDKKPPEVQVSGNKPEENLVEKSRSDTGKSKAEVRAERRAKQEAQRAAKEAERRSKLEQQSNQVPPPQKEKKIEILLENKIQKEKVVTPAKAGHQRVKLFSHLKFQQKTSEAKLMPNIHPDIVKLGRKYSSRIIMGSNARCVALLTALKEVIMDYITPSEKEFSRGLESQLSCIMAYLNKCRPSAVSMTNAVRHIKSHLTQLPNDITDVEARRKLCDVIDTFIREQIDVAGEAICNAVQKKIANGDNILIYACSSLLFRILVESHKDGKQFTVVVVDSGPWFEGREMLRRLVDHGIKCSYVLISALSFIMREVTKVLLGAHALLANGSVMSRTGSALVALVASTYNVPVLVCCETYKFCERVQMDAFVYNELGNEDDMDYSRAENKKENDSTVATLSVLYDITPADLVTAVVTELAILPCTSVPVILRIRPSDVVS